MLKKTMPNTAEEIAIEPMGKYAQNQQISRGE